MSLSTRSSVKSIQLPPLLILASTVSQLGLLTSLMRISTFARLVYQPSGARMEMVNLGSTTSGSLPSHFVRSFLQISQPVLTAPAAHLSVQVHFSGSAGGSGSVGVSGSVGCSGSVDVSGAFPMHCARSDWQTAQSGFTAPSWHRTVQIQAAGSPAGGAVHKSISAAQAGHSVL